MGHVLACVGFFDAIILGCLAHTLAGKKMKLIEELDQGYYQSRGGSMYKGEINPGFLGDNQSLAGSRKSVNLQPVMLMPHGHADMDRYSEYSQRTGRASHSPFRGAPMGPHMQHNFQL